MSRLYLTPASISYLTQSILALAITGYFIYRTQAALRTSHWTRTAFLAGFFAAITMFSLLLFLETSLPRGEDLYVLFPQNTIVALGMVFLLQFAYRFPTLSPRRKWESRAVLVLSLLYALWEFFFAVHRFRLLQAGQVIWRPEHADYALAAGLLWAPVMLLRQAAYASDPSTGGLKSLRYLRRPQGREAQAARDLALVYMIPFVLSLVNIFAAFYIVSRATYHVSLSLGILISLAAFAVAYLDHLPETTSFIVKLLAFFLTVLLAVLGTVGWAIAPAYAAHYEPDLVGRRTMRFTPNAQGSYDVTALPFHFEQELGASLGQIETYERWATAVDFTFPFYGQTYHQVYVSNDGAIGMGQNIRYSYLHYRYGGGIPVIFPLLIDLSPEASPDGVRVCQDAGRLVITWDRMPSFYHPEAVFTFQAVLYSDGAFDITYADIPDELAYIPNDESGANPWVAGAVPGDLSRRPQEVDFSTLPVTGDGRGMVQDYQLGFRRYLHQALAPLAYLIVGSSLLAIAGFPILLYTSLVRPLNALLRGVQQMNAGHYNVDVDVLYSDEIGFLTRSFNTMAAELGALISSLEERVEQRLVEIKKINTELAREIAEHEQTEAKLRRSHEQIQILHAIDQAILGAQSPQTIAQSILGRLPQLIPCQRVSVIEFGADTARVLAVEASHGFAADTAGWLDQLHAAASGKPHIHAVVDIRELAARSPLQDRLLVEGICAYLVVPLLAQEQVIGALTIEHDQPDVLTAEHIDLAAQIGSMLAVSIHQAQLRVSLHQRTQELEAQNAELDAYAHTVAHDLKNPISIVASGAQLLVGHGNEMSPEKRRQAAYVVAEGAFKAASIVDNLLLLASAHKITVDLEAVDMAAAVDEALKRLSNMLQEYQAEVALPSRWPQAAGYAPWIEEVWFNYLSNGMKYGGRPPRLELGATEQADGTIRFWVHDNGHGLTPAEQSRLFTPFERLAQTHIEGHGIGLSIVRRIVEKLGGQVGVESAPGQGSVFFFTLPAAPTRSSSPGS
ncbi:MAG: HAMP domain-containing protein [Anaerolineae bacterium]|nr:HAMP domain-containing protein [Anaerolineae bacterium]